MVEEQEAKGERKGCGKEGMGLVNRIKDQDFTSLLRHQKNTNTNSSGG